MEHPKYRVLILDLSRELIFWSSLFVNSFPFNVGTITVPIKNPIMKNTINFLTTFIYLCLQTHWFSTLEKNIFILSIEYLNKNISYIKNIFIICNIFKKITNKINKMLYLFLKWVTIVQYHKNEFIKIKKVGNYK